MTINYGGYFNSLKTYLKQEYGETCVPKERFKDDRKSLVLSEPIDGSKERRKIVLNYDGDAFAIRLDLGSNPLFHFLTNDRFLWAKRCDFVVFHCIDESIKVYCIEFKEARTIIPEMDINLQLKAGLAWVQSLQAIVGGYYGQAKELKLSKFVFTNCQTNNPPELDSENQCLRRFPDVRHFRFDEVDGQNLNILTNSSIHTLTWRND